MAKEINSNKQQKDFNQGLVMKIVARTVTAAHVDKVIAERPQSIVFTKNVRKFDMLAFKDVDCSRFLFSTAVNLEKIGTKCFKNAKNIHWCEVLEGAEKSENSFENAHIFGKENINTI